MSGQTPSKVTKPSKYHGAKSTYSEDRLARMAAHPTPPRSLAAATPSPAAGHSQNHFQANYAMPSIGAQYPPGSYHYTGTTPQGPALGPPPQPLSYTHPNPGVQPQQQMYTGYAAPPHPTFTGYAASQQSAQRSYSYSTASPPRISQDANAMEAIPGGDHTPGPGRDTGLVSASKLHQTCLRHYQHYDQSL